MLGLIEVHPSWTWKSVAASDGGHTCAIRSNDTLWCWGYNGDGQLGDGQLGDGTTTTRTNPVPVGTATWKSVTGGADHTCGIRCNDTLWCWGYNHYGQIGDATTADRARPVQIGTATWRTVAAGSEHSCGIQKTGTLRCWGYNGSGQLGNGTTNTSSSPVPIGTLTSWYSIAAGGNFTLATLQ